MSTAAWWSGLVAIAVLLAMASDRWPPHRIALGGFALLMLGGSLDTDSVLRVIGSTGLVTVVCMFVLAAALEQTGVIDRAVRGLLQVAGTRPRSAWALFFALVLIGSSVVPNTPVVMLACPAAMLLAQRTRIGNGRLLLPIAQLATLGGSLTLIGSSVNVVSSNLLQEHGGQALRLFDTTPVALPVALAGALMVWLGSRRLPAGEPASAKHFQPGQRFLSEHVVSAQDDWAQRRIGETLAQRVDVEVLELWRSGLAVALPAGAALVDHRPQAGDRLLLRQPASALVEQFRLTLPRIDDQLCMEVWIPPYSRWCGLPIGQLRLDIIHGLRLLGVAPLLTGDPDLSRHCIAAGDRLLLAGPRPEIERVLATGCALGPLQIERSSQLRDRAPLALGMLAFIIVAPACAWLSLEVAALVAAILLGLGGALRGMVTGSPMLVRTLGVLMGMLGIGAALESNGVTAAMVGPLLGAAAGQGPWVLLVASYLCASLLSELVTNNAVAVLVLPLVLGVTQSLGLDPLPFTLAVLFGASSSFATPVGYQTNTLVYQLGRYRFVDFLRAGLPLKLVHGGVALLMIDLLYPV